MTGTIRLGERLRKNDILSIHTAAFPVLMNRRWLRGVLTQLLNNTPYFVLLHFDAI